MSKSPASHILWLLLLALFALACSSDPRQPETENALPENPEGQTASPDFTVEPGKRVGGITVNSTEADIKALYGEDQVQFRSVYIGEGESQPGVVVFPNTPNELEIVWDIAAATGNPEFIRASQKGSSWRTADGVTVGTSLEELERINGKPFSIYGFGWDYGGLVTDWQGGELNAHLIVALVPGKPELVGAKVSGDQAFSSDDPNIQAVEPRVGSMVITFKK